VKIKFYEIYEIFAKRFEPFLNSNKIQIRFFFEFCNSKSRELLELGQKVKLCPLKLSISIPSLENFE
jgi:hypothetical protein